jgi:hypothetical protein
MPQSPSAGSSDDLPGPALESLVEKYLTQNQMFASRQAAGQSPRPENLPIYISCYINGYGQPWTPLDVNPKIRPVHGQIAGPSGCCFRLRIRRLT